MIKNILNKRKKLRKKYLNNQNSENINLRDDKAKKFNNKIQYKNYKIINILLLIIIILLIFFIILLIKRNVNNINNNNINEISNNGKNIIDEDEKN